MKASEQKNTSPITRSAKPFFDKRGEEAFFAVHEKRQPEVQPKRRPEPEPEEGRERVADAMSSPVIQPKPLGDRPEGFLEDEERIELSEIQKKEQAAPPITPQERSFGLPQPGLETRLNSSKGSGAPLPETVKAEMETAFAADLSPVRIHTDPAAVEMSESLNAQAFTHGGDIYFNEGKYDPQGMEGKRLLAHEITHTRQQGATTSIAPRLQRAEEEMDLAQMLRDLIESNREQSAAFDPAEAKQTQQEAEAKGEEAEQDARSEVPEVKPVAPEQLASGSETTSRVATPTPRKPDKVVPRVKAAPEVVSVKPEAETETAPPLVEAAPEMSPAGSNAPPPPPADAGVTPPETGGDTASETPKKGPVGQSLDEQSASVCNDAAEKAQELADNESAHDTAEEKATQTEVAVEPPEKEGQSRSNAEQVNTLEEATPPQPDSGDTRQEMDEAISRAVPSKIKELNEFESKKKAQVIGNKVLADVSRQAGEVQGAFNQIEQAPPAAESEVPIALPEIEQAPDTSQLNLGAGAVPAVSTEQTDLSAYKEQADGIYEKEGISTDMQAEFEKVDSGDLAEANKEKATLNEKVENEPAHLQEFARNQQQGVAKDLQKQEDRARGEMENKRKRELEGAQGKQEKTKTEMEKKREAVTKWINDRYLKAQTLVKEKLQNLEKQALTRFDTGQKQLSVQFEQNVKRRVNQWKDKRYSGFWGAAKWVKDKFVGIDHFPEIKEIFTSERATFVAGVDRLIIDIDRENQLTIEACKAELAKARTDIQEYVDQLKPELKDVGQKAQQETEKKLAELDAHIESEKKKLQQKLCDAKEAAIQAIDKKIEEMKAEMSGLVGKLGALLLYAAKKFFKWAIEKLGGNADRIIGILDKGAAVLKSLFTDPIGFFKNLVKAVGGGINRFIDNIVGWLKKGLVSWLMGQMGDSGLQLPEKFDMKGILFLGLQVAGLTWNVIRARLVKKLGTQGERIVGTAEKSIDIFKRVLIEGPIALWHILVEKAGEIKKQAMEGIRNWAILEIVKKATFKILSMLNPAGAIVQAIIMLYDVVMFFIENWNRILDFVKSVFDSIGAIASGAVGQAAQFIENTLGKTIPIMLSFFARFVGLSGIGTAVKNIIKAIQRPFKKILDKIVGFLVKQVKRLVKGGKKVAGKVKDKAIAILQWWKQRKKFKSKDGKEHALYFKGKGKKAKATVASNPEDIKVFLKAIAGKVKGDDVGNHANALRIVDEIAAMVNGELPDIKGDAKGMQGGKPETAVSKLSSKLNDLSVLMQKLMHYRDSTGEFGTKEKPFLITWHKPLIPDSSAYPNIELELRNANGIKRKESFAPTQIKEAVVYEANPTLRDLVSRLGKFQLKNLLASAKKNNIDPNLIAQLAHLQQGVLEVEAIWSVPGNESKQKPDILSSGNSILSQLKTSLASAGAKYDLVELASTTLQELIQADGDPQAHKLILGIHPLNQPKKGLVIGPRRGSKGIRKMEREFKKMLLLAGYDMNEKGEPPEHIIDLSLGGPDNFQNLWPMSKNARNASPQQLIDMGTGKQVKQRGENIRGISDKNFPKETYFLIENG